MARSASQILHDAMELPVEARAALADSLLDSLDTEMDVDAEQAWRNEIEQRITSLNRGTAQRIAWKDVETHLRSRFHR